ncbi:ATP-dependent nuclease [Amycolatopsis plumensis]|uniref:ATP-dependent endonuclease n=1 Tax=Amycolatopsis plumensis TaxID=236508 RepID=A0ABV5U8X5_9PSEU
MVLKLRSLELRSGEEVEIADGLTVVVGPNNVGKSLLLREIGTHLALQVGQEAHPPNKILRQVTIDFATDRTGFLDWVRSTYPVQAPDAPGAEERIRTNSGTVLTLGQLDNAWQYLHRSPGSLGTLSPLLVLQLDAQGRLNQPFHGQGFNPFREPATGMAQLLYQNRDFEREMSDLLRRAFGEPLTVNRYAGNQITLHVGEVTAAEPAPPPSHEYLRQLGELPDLGDQGDGFRAFASILFALKTSHYPIVLIDEPEAFLHPPQAYLLGRFLAEEHAAGSQVIVATHSADVIKGITSVRADHEVVITRLTRRGETNHVASIAPAKVRTLYDDPLVKYYPIVDGLFARGVIVCEAESDCTYYRAVLETEASASGLHFTHCNGKARVGRAVDALRSARVPVVAILDIDFLRDDKDFSEVVIAQGGDPDSFAKARAVIENSVQSWGRKIDRTAAKAIVEAQFARSKAATLSGGEIARIKEAVSPVSGWREFKKYGAHHLSGDAVTAFEQLDRGLRELGIFVVPGGELERFHPDVSGDNKAEWLRTVLETGRYENSAAARDFVLAAAEFISDHQ